jgi:Tol biopolymer transport system component
MKKPTSAALAAVVFCVMGLLSQDRFPVPRLTFDPAQDSYACWYPEGKRIAFNSTRSGNFDIWMMDVDPEQLKKELQSASK